ncbi:MAG TPA: YHS domain-containing protein [Polyangia bacterium]|nr:YHS domain-containing protein [Polyangia bacterium]
MTKDPVCGKEVDPLRARAVGIFGGVTYYFCSQDCKARFKDPRKTPREPTREITSKPNTLKAPPPAAPAVAAAGGESKNFEGEEQKPPVAVDKPWAKRAREAEESVKVDPSPSVQEELRAVQPSGSRAWVLVIFLFALAGIVLFFYLSK